MQSLRVVFEHMAMSEKDILGSFPQISPQENKMTTQKLFLRRRKHLVNC